MVSGGGVENSSAQLEQQRQTESQAGVNSIREWRHRVTQRRPSTRERVQQTRALLNERRCGGFRCQSRTGSFAERPVAGR